MKKKKVKLIKCPSCKKPGYVVSVFGSICPHCFYDTVSTVPPKYNLTLRDFPMIAEWEQIEHIMKPRTYKKFCKFMEGQTCSSNGVYSGDLDRFLRGLPVID